MTGPGGSAGTEVGVETILRKITWVKQAVGGGDEEDREVRNLGQTRLLTIRALPCVAVGGAAAVARLGLRCFSLPRDGVVGIVISWG